LLLELIRRESFTKEELDAGILFEDFQAKNPREIQLIGLKQNKLQIRFVNNLGKRSTGISG
jgi:DNA polymerase-3 subunit alpha